MSLLHSGLKAADTLSDERCSLLQSIVSVTSLLLEEALTQTVEWFERCPYSDASPLFHIQLTFPSMTAPISE